MARWYGICKDFEGGTPIFIVEAPSSFLAMHKIMTHVLNVAIDEGEIDELWLGEFGFELKMAGELPEDQRHEYDNDDNNIHL